VLDTAWNDSVVPLICTSHGAIPEVTSLYPEELK
jgi:hypothetical protein